MTAPRPDVLANVLHVYRHLALAECTPSMVAQLQRGEYDAALAILVPQCLHHAIVVLQYVAAWENEGEVA